MDFKVLVDEITRRVLAKIDALDHVQQSGEKPRLLILTAAEQSRFDHFLSNTRLGSRFDLTCMPDPDPDCDLSAYQAVILFNLKVDELARISSGVCGTPYSCLVARSILNGKPVYLPAKEIELLCYEQTAPPPYYAMMKRKLDLLASSGVVICSLEEIENALLNQPFSQPVPCGTGAPTGCPAEAQPTRGCPWRVDKRVLTERDLIEARLKGASEVQISAGCIITDLALEFAKARQITLVRNA